MNPLPGGPVQMIPNQQGTQNTRNALQTLNFLLRPNQNSANRNQQPTFNSFRVSIAATKVALSFLVLAFSPTTCNQPLDKWLMHMMIYDLLVILAQYLVKWGTPVQNEPDQNSVQPGYLLGAAASGNENRREYNFEGGLDEESGLPAPQINLNRSSRYSDFFSETCRTILLAKIQTFTTFYYIFIFFYGQMLFLNLDEACAINAPALVRLVYTYIVFQYLTFVIPFVLICLCVIVLFIIVRRYSHLLPNNQVPANEALINNLPSHKYPLELPGDPECRICMCEYADDEEIIKLPCNAMHHFHGECIKKWLRVNGVCPICRKKIEEMSQGSILNVGFD